MHTGSRTAGRRRRGQRFAAGRPWIMVPFLVAGSWFVGIGGAYGAAPAAPAIYVDGKLVFCDVPPYVTEGRVMVPIRQVAESLGAQIRWSEREQTVYVDRGTLHLVVPIGKKVLYRNGEAIPTDVAPVVIQGRTMVPVRVVAEALGEKVEWDQGRWAVVIVTPAPPSGTSASGAKGGTPTVPGTSGQSPGRGEPPVPVGKSTGKLLPAIEVKAADSAVSRDEVERVRKILDQSGIFDRLCQDIPGSLTDPVHIYVVDTRDGFKKVLSDAGIPADQVEMFSAVTSGAAFGNDIYLPLYMVADDAQIANVLAHELTHVYLDQSGMGADLPVWMNEGLAWREGLAAQARFQPGVVYQGSVERIHASIIDSRRRQLLVPLSAITEDLILHSPQYNLEWQGYVALERLADRGWERVRSYLDAVRDGVPDAFVRTFGITESAFEQQVNQWLDAQAKQPDGGVTLTFEVQPGFDGNIGFLPRGTDSWTKFRVTPGTYRVTIRPDGTVTGLSGGKTVSTLSGADPNTMFIGVQPVQAPSGAVREEGGFAVSYAYGRYFYQNAWTREVGDLPVFSQSDTVLGVRLLDIRPVQNPAAR